MLEHRPVRHSSDTGVIRTVAHADVHGAVVAGDLYLRPGRLLRIGLRIGPGPLPDIVIGHGGHQGSIHFHSLRGRERFASLPAPITD